MAETKTTSSRSRSTTRKATTRSASRPATARKASATKGAATRKGNAAKRNARSTQRTASRATARTQTAAAREAAQARREAETTFTKVGDVAERAVLTYVGATLEARDRVVGIVETATDRTKLERQLKKYERRGNTTRNRVERELKKQRTRVERELRQRTNRFERDAKPVAELVGAQVENVANGVALAGSKAAKVATERVAALV